MKKGLLIGAFAAPCVGAWLAGERHAVLLGPDPHPDPERSPMAEARGPAAVQMRSVDLDPGALQIFHRVLHRDGPVDETAKTTP